MKKNLTRILSLLLVLVLMVGVLPVSALADGWDLTGELDTEQLLERAEPVEMQSKPAVDGYDYSIMFLDCGRKYYSVDSIKQLRDNASAAGFNYIQLAVGNDGLRFLLDDMELTVGSKTYTSEAVSSAIHAGNEKYYNFDVDELTQTEMDTIIAYANSKGMGVIPCVNTPGHMDAILDAATSLTGQDCSYKNSIRTIDVTNTTAVAFTQALLQKYITYFAGKGCQLFNMGADEYANDKFTGGSMGFGNLQSTGKYSYYVNYVNDVAGMVKRSGMTPMAFNDGIYFNSNTSSGTFDTDIIICYWSNGWSGYYPMSASDLAAPDKGFKLVNTSGAYYWVLGKPNDQCSAEKARGFNYQTFPKQGGDETISNPAGAMFCIWGDNPGAETEASVISKTAATIAAFGGTLPGTKPGSTTPVFKVVGDVPNGGTLTMGSALTLRVPEGMTAIWTASPEGIVQIEVADSANATRSAAVTGSSVNVTALKAGEVTITATNPENTTQTATFALTVSDPDAPKTETVTLTVGQTDTRTQDVKLNGTYTPDPAGIASVEVTAEPVAGETTYVPVTSLTAGTFYVSTKANDNTPTVTLTLEDAGNGQYYLKDSSGQYIYPSATRNVGYWDYTLGTGKKAVDVAVNNGKVTISRQCSDTTILGKPVTTTAHLKLNDTSFGATDSETFLYLYKQQTQLAGWKSTITFKGLAVGNTTVKIGNVTYNITVTEQNLETVTPLSVEYWITNAQPKGTDGKTFASIAATTGTIASEAGHDAADLLPKTTNRDSRDVDYWHCRLLDKTLENDSSSGTEAQTNTDGDDETDSGIAFTKIRYFNGAWSVFTANNEWVTVESKHQLVAYYTEHIAVTDEVDSHAADWGNLGDGTLGGWLDTYNYCTLSFQVVYEDGSQNPNGTTADALRSRSIVYGYWSDNNGRGIGTVLLNGNEHYEIIKVTAETGEANATITDNNRATINTLTWDENELSVWEDANGSNEVVLHNSSKKFSKEGINANLCWDENKEAILLRIYVRAKVTEDSLTVRYVDNANNEEFYHYSIAVTSSTTFDPDFALSGNQNQLINNTVTNIKGVTQTVTAELGNLTEIAAQYRHSKYTCTSAVLSDNNKTVTLYYTFTNIVNFVIDFGLPITIAPADVSGTLVDSGVTLNSITVTGVNDGTVTIDEGSKAFTYTPNANFLKHDGEKLTVTYTGSLLTEDGQQNSAVSYQVYIFPASNILYEENFLTQGDLNKNDRLSWISETATQLTGKSQSTHKNDASERYGYDDVYQSITGRNGAWTVSGLSASNSASKVLTTEFYGNALDIIGSCGENTATLSVVIRNLDDESAPRKNLIIDTRYNGATLEQVPFSHIDLNVDAHYSVKIRAYYAPAIAASNTNTAATFGAVSAISDFAASSSYADQAVWNQMARDLAEDGLTLDDAEFVRFADTPAAQTDSLAVYADLYSVQQPARQEGTELAIDAFRVYRTASTIHTVPKNYLESEQNIDYKNILELVNNTIVKAYVENGTATKVTVEEYEAMGGPLDEIYLSQNESVTIQVPETTGNTIQVSLRAVQGATSWADTTTGNTPATISSNTEMYYTVKAGNNGVFTITNRGDALLAVGNVKLPSNAKTTSTSEIDEDALRASVCAALGLSAEQPQAFQPKTFTARATTLPMLRNKRVSVLITISNDVSYVTVNGVKYTPSRYYASWQKTRLIQFGETLGKYESKTYTIIAYDANGVASAPITVNG